MTFSWRRITLAVHGEFVTCLRSFVDVVRTEAGPLTQALFVVGIGADRK